LTKRGSYGYHCNKCHEYFQHLWQLAAHSANTHKTGRRTLGGKGLQFTIPTNIPKNHIDRKIRARKTGANITCTYFIPKTWQHIRIHAPIEKDGGIWVFFEPLPVEETRPSTKKY